MPTPLECSGVRWRFCGFLDGLDALGEQNLWLRSVFPVAILCSDEHFQGAVPARKKEWITPKISPMDSSCTDGNGKDYGKPEGLTGSTEYGNIVSFGPS